MRPNRLVRAIVLAVSLSFSGSSQAEPPRDAAAERALTEKARELYLEGLKAYENKEWAKAHVSFLAAWNLKKHYQIAGNLGDCELKMGRYRDAAEHLFHALREVEKDKESEPNERERAQKLFDQASAKVATLELRTKVAGAEIFVDDKLVGLAPLDAPLFVDAGEHTLSARAEGYVSSKKSLTLDAGAKQEIELSLERPPPPEPEITRPARQSSNKATWITLGSVLAVGGLGTGLAMTVLANGKAEDAEDLRPSTGPNGCVNPSGDAKATCATLLELVEDQSTFGNVALGSFLAGGIFAVGTIGLALWPSSNAKPKAARVELTLLPQIGQTRRGISVLGAW